MSSSPVLKSNKKLPAVDEEEEEPGSPQPMQAASRSVELPRWDGLSASIDSADKNRLSFMHADQTVVLNALQKGVESSPGFFVSPLYDRINSNTNNGRYSECSDSPGEGMEARDRAVSSNEEYFQLLREVSAVLVNVP